MARVNYDIAVAQYERSIQSSFREVADALAGRATLGEQVRAQAAQTNALAITYRLADLRYRAGAAELPRGARGPALALRVAAVAGADAGAAAAEPGVLYRALGGGWREASEIQAVSNPEIPPPR